MAGGNPEMAAIREEMAGLDQGQRADACHGLFFRDVWIPKDLIGLRQLMLNYGNAGRRDPGFRASSGASTATDLSGSTVRTKGGHQEEVIKDSDSPPYFTGHVLNDALNNAAQLQAEYVAKYSTIPAKAVAADPHIGPESYTPMPDAVDSPRGVPPYVQPRKPGEFWSDPKTDLSDFSVRAKYFGFEGQVVEAVGAKAELGDCPHSWMSSDTHFRPWFNVDGSYPQIGYGAAAVAELEVVYEEIGGRKTGSSRRVYEPGSWYFVAVAAKE